MNILLVLNQTQTSTLEKEFDFVIGVDGGCQWCMDQQITMDLAIGDFDSLNTDSLQQLSIHAIEVKQYNTDKDLTDLELALEAIKSLPAKHLTVLGCWGGRIDHQTANLFCLAKQTANIPVAMPGPQNAYLLKAKQKIVIEQTIGETISIMAMLSDCTGIHNQGMKFPLNGATLKLGAAVGLSNINTMQQSSVQLDSGCLLVTTHRQAQAQIFNLEN